MITITGENQGSRNDVVSKHLPMILSTCLDIDDYDLLKPEGILDEDIPLSKSTNLPIRPISP